ncbi:MAG: zinc ribbon domain-containing protein [bacterium]|uniref:Zinc ribbon domain-containing protein n=1 Tax=Candidatus Aphodosoma intestinipullorum TaxID=2840674 RepID=A0A940DK79_9BACT|nr:zinc ribbon domain-containing protein [Candidatus Aphodosoma intestinipullorum]
MYCKECGFQLSEGTKYCPNCGTKVELSGMGNIEQNAVWGKIDDEDTAGDSNSVAKKAHWENGHGGTEERKSEQTVKAPEVTVAQKKEIKKERKQVRERVRNVSCGNSDYMDNIFVVHEEYYEDDRYIRSESYWYVDATGKRISGFYDWVSSEIINGTATIVKSHGKYSCGKFENNHLREITKTIFGRNCDNISECVNFHEQRKKSFVLGYEDRQNANNAEDRLYMYDDTGLYRVKRRLVFKFKYIAEMLNLYLVMMGFYCLFCIIGAFLCLPVVWLICFFLWLTFSLVFEMFGFDGESSNVMEYLEMIACDVENALNGLFGGENSHEPGGYSFFLSLIIVNVLVLSIKSMRDNLFYFFSPWKMSMPFYIKKGRLVTDPDIFLKSTVC